jgi:hypothetical protein
MSFLIFDAGYAIVVNRYGANFEHVAAKLWVWVFSNSSTVKICRESQAICFNILNWLYNFDKFLNLAEI